MIIKITLYTKNGSDLKVKQDIIIEGSEIVTYKTLIEISQRIPDLDVNLIVPLLKHNLEEEINMQKWCMDNLPMAIDSLLPRSYPQLINKEEDKLFI